MRRDFGWRQLETSGDWSKRNMITNRNGLFPIVRRARRPLMPPQEAANEKPVVEPAKDQQREPAKSSDETKDAKGATEQSE
jgi:hypothetical protein